MLTFSGLPFSPVKRDHGCLVKLMYKSVPDRAEEPLLRPKQHGAERVLPAISSFFVSEQDLFLFCRRAN